MKPLTLTLLALLTASCTLPQSSSFQRVTPVPTPMVAKPATTVGSAKAVYLTRDGGGTLPSSELQAHPEVLVVTSFEHFKDEAQSKIALWIDENAVDLLAADSEWIHQPPQRYYPVVLVGYNSALYSFRDVLGGFGIEGPPVDQNPATLEPGFSVWMITKDRGQGSVAAFMKGYAEVPSVERLLEITNELLPQSLAR